MKIAMLAAAALTLGACGPTADQDSALAPEDSVATANAARDGYGATTPDSVAAEESGRASAATGASEPAANDAAGGDAAGSTP